MATRRDAIDSWKRELDSLVGVYNAHRVDGGYRSPAGHSAAGRWLGCWINSRHHLFGPAWMDLGLDIDANVVRGEGRDRLGAFRMQGELDETARLVRMTKHYLDTGPFVPARPLPYHGIVDDDALRGVYTVNGEQWHLFAFYHAQALEPKTVARVSRQARRGWYAELALSLLTASVRRRAIAREAALAARFRALFPEL